MSIHQNVTLVAAAQLFGLFSAGSSFWSCREAAVEEVQEGEEVREVKKSAE